MNLANTKRRTGIMPTKVKEGWNTRKTKKGRRQKANWGKGTFQARTHKPMNGEKKSKKSQVVASH